jgi:hypothetical protein
MRFDSKEQQDLYFDSLIDIFKDQDYIGFEMGVSQLNVLQRKQFLVYVYRNKDSLNNFNSQIMFKLILDYL